MATIADVANRAGVSKSTVSRTFSQPDSVDAATRERVYESAEALNYHPRGNRARRGRPLLRSRSIGLVVPDISNPFFAPMIRAAITEGLINNIAVFVVDTDEHREDDRQVVEGLLDRVDGLVLVSPRLSDEELLQLATECPLTVVNRDLEGVMGSVLNSPDGFEQAAGHLAALGHQRILFFAGPADNRATAVRRRILQSASERLKVDLIVHGPFSPTFEGGRAAADVLLAERVSATIVFNDLGALGLMDRLQSKGIIPGKDVSVIGTDDIWMGAVHRPALTTVRVASGAVGSAVVRMFQRTWTTSDPPASRVVMPTELIVRETTDFRT